MPEQDITQLIAQVRRGDEAASDDLFRRVYRELRQLAAHYMRHERRDHTLQPTALVHEAYLRLIDQRHLTSEAARTLVELYKITKNPQAVRDWEAKLKPQ